MAGSTPGRIRGWTALGLEPAFGGMRIGRCSRWQGLPTDFILNGLRLLAFAIAGIPERQSAHCGMVDAIFSEPRLAAIYDALDSDRSDLDVYASIVDELAARSVLDLGCGTGTFACLLANRGKEVTAVDPAAASVAVAQRKAGAECVRWLVGDAGIVPALRVDLVTMTGNVAQVFVTDDEWMSTLRASFAALRPGGHLVFEIRHPAREAWREWRREESHRRVSVDVRL